MMIICNNASRIATNGTIYKFIVIRISLYQFELICRRYLYSGFTIEDKTYNKLGGFPVGKLRQNLLVFTNY